MCFAKSRVLLGVIGLFVPVVALAGAVRLARPDSPWAKWRYDGGAGARGAPLRARPADGARVAAGQRHGRRSAVEGGAMRVLYGVNGEGMGHATRSLVVIERLLERGDEVRVVASGAAYRFLRERLPRVEEIFGPSFAMREGEIRRWATLGHSAMGVPRELPETVRHWLDVVHEWRPEVVVTDFEPLAGVYARSHHVPLVSVDNIHMIDRCLHDGEVVGVDRVDYAIARAVTRAMIPPAGDYVITTFFRPPVLHARTTLVPPILRPEVVAAEPEAGEHLLVYSSGSPALLQALRDRRALPRVRDARRAGGCRPTARSSSGRARPTGSSRTCGPRAAWSRAEASRCWARRSTSASPCCPRRCTASSSS